MNYTISFFQVPRHFLSELQSQSSSDSHLSLISSCVSRPDRVTRLIESGKIFRVCVDGRVVVGCTIRNVSNRFVFNLRCHVTFNLYSYRTIMSLF